MRDLKFKVLLVGEANVGKSSIILNFTEGVFRPTTATLGVDMKSKQLKTRFGQTVNLCIYDTSGTEKFDAIIPSLYRKTHGLLLVFSVADRKSFEKLDKWLEEIRLHSDQSAVVLLIGNKIDLDERQVTKEEALKYAKNRSMTYLETSAKLVGDTNEAFFELVDKIMDNPENYRNVDSGTVNLRAQDVKRNESDACWLEAC